MRTQFERAIRYPEIELKPSPHFKVKKIKKQRKKNANNTAKR